MSLGHPEAAQQAAGAAGGEGTVSEGPSVDAAAPGCLIHEPQAHTWHTHTDPNHSTAVLRQAASGNAAQGQTPHHAATAGAPQAASSHLPVLEGHPVPVVAAANGQLAVLSSRLDDGFLVAEPTALAQNQAQLYYVIRSEEAGNQRHDLQALAADAGMYGEGASAFVEQTMQGTVGARDAAARRMLDDANIADTEELLSAILSEPQEVALQQVLYTDAVTNHHQQSAPAGAW